MHAIRRNIVLLIICSTIIAVSAAAILSMQFIAHNELRDSEQVLLLMCETGERNLDYYFNSVQNSVGKVSSFVEDDLDGLEDEKLQAHIERVEKYFGELAYKTSGVFTYYYRIDPEISDTVKGFWYINTTGEGFVPHEVTDITKYDTDDTSKLVWFTVPKHLDQSIWLPPYITDNLDVRVISYNTPIKWKGQFVGVVGIEIDYSAMAKLVDNIRVGTEGYAFLNSADGRLFYHRDIPVSGENVYDHPEGLFGDSTFVRYTYEGVDKQAAWLPLSNGMRLTVTIPVSEIVGQRNMVLTPVILASAAVLLIVCAVSSLISLRLTRTLKEKPEEGGQEGG